MTDERHPAGVDLKTAWEGAWNGGWYSCHRDGDPADVFVGKMAMQHDGRVGVEAYDEMERVAAVCYPKRHRFHDLVRFTRRWYIDRLVTWQKVSGELTEAGAGGKRLIGGEWVDVPR